MCDTPDTIISKRVNTDIKYCHMKSSLIVKTTKKVSVFLSKRWYKHSMVSLLNGWRVYSN